MHPKYYLDSNIFEREQQKIFRKVWLFAGLKTQLSKHNAFITRKIAGIPVVIQNFHGELHAFENVCLHRSALIQTEPTGCRPLVCPYHGWKYDDKGHVSHIPHCDSIYHFSDTQKQFFKLREFSLRAVGNLIFVNLDNHPLALEEQFSPDFLVSLESSSNSYDSEVMATTWTCRFNWKLPYENLRDFNHITYVHPKTLAKAVTFLPSINEKLLQASAQELPDTSPFALRKEMCTFSFGGKDADIPKMQRFAWHDLVQRWGNENAYYNWLAYPNLHIASANGGYSFTIENHIPISPGCTNIEVYRFTSRKKQPPFKSSSAVLLAEMHESKLVVGEDVKIMEAVQAALHTGAPHPTQGAYEGMNRLIERWYHTLMETENGL